LYTYKLLTDNNANLYKCRFIGSNGKIQKDEKLIPFSTGKRLCPGESLAKAELFLFFAGLLQKFKFEPIDPDNLPQIEVVSGVTSSPLPYDVKVIRLL
jgi:cytochrome P450